VSVLLALNKLVNPGKLTWVSWHQKHTIHIQLAASLSLTVAVARMNPSSHFPPFVMIIIRF